MKLTPQDTDNVYRKIKHLAYKAFECHNYERAILELERSARVAYLFNSIYSDVDSENLIRQISDRIISSPVNISFPDREKYVFYDSFGWDNRGLTQQYIRAFKALKIDFLYIYENRSVAHSKCLNRDLEECGEHATIYELDQSKSSTEQIHLLYDKITQYGPSKIFLHIAPWAVKALCVCYALPQIKKYNINLTDHAFWLGTGCIDHNIEFRDYGYIVSIEKRGFKPEQLILLPYYPIINHNKFEGFPIDIPADAVKIFSGGAFYKIYGEKGVYFDIVKRILLENPQVVLLYAGSGDAGTLQKFIEENKLEARFILLGDRKDIDEVFNACDIYLCTYPFTGALMAQYAAVNGKPILSYSSSDFPTNYIEEIVCYINHKVITYTDLDKFYCYANQLCRDKMFREQDGKLLKDCVIDPELFNSKVGLLLDKDDTGIIRSNKYVINYQRFADLYLEVENQFQNTFKVLVIREYKFRSFFLFPQIAFKIALRLVPKYIKKYFYK